MSNLNTFNPLSSVRCGWHLFSICPAHNENPPKTVHNVVNYHHYGFQ